MSFTTSSVWRTSSGWALPGALQEEVRLYDLVLGQGACTDSNWAAQFHLAGTFAPIGSFDLLTRAVEAARELGCRYHVGNVLSSDAFYGDHEGVPEAWTPTMAGKRWAFWPLKWRPPHYI